MIAASLALLYVVYGHVQHSAVHTLVRGTILARKVVSIFAHVSHLI